jgi:hypothetical protein
MAKPTGRSTAATKIDWVAARKWYLADARRSYSMVAKKFGVTKQAVEAQAKKEPARTGIPASWATVRRDLGEQANEQHDTKLAEDNSKRDEHHLGLIYELQDILASKIHKLSHGVTIQNKHGQTLTYPEGHEQAGDPILVMPDSLELYRTAKALRTVIDGERVIRGRPTTIAAMTNKDGDDLNQVGWADMLLAAQEAMRASDASPGA